MLRMWFRMLLFGSGAVNETSSASLFHFFFCRFGALPLIWRARRAERQMRETIANANEPLFEPVFENDERRVQLEAAISRLPASQREVLVLKIWGGLTFEEIAVQLSIPANTAASRHRYALAAIKTELTAPCTHG